MTQPETIILYTYEDAISLYQRREAQKKVKRKAERIYYMKQKLAGLAMLSIGIVIPFLLEGEATLSLVIVLIGLYLMITSEKIMKF